MANSERLESLLERLCYIQIVLSAFLFIVIQTTPSGLLQMGQTTAEIPFVNLQVSLRTIGLLIPIPICLIALGTYLAAHSKEGPATILAFLDGNRFLACLASLLVITVPLFVAGHSIWKITLAPGLIFSQPSIWDRDWLALLLPMSLHGVGAGLILVGAVLGLALCCAMCGIGRLHIHRILPVAALGSPPISLCDAALTR